MPRGVYEHKKNQGFQKGHKPFSLVRFSKGNIPHNKGLKGYSNKGTFKHGHYTGEGELNPNWKGGVTNYHSGYKRIRVNGKYKALHRLVMERHLGRELKTNEIVHHIDKDKTNNDISNLMLMTHADHSRLHKSYEKK